MANNTFHGIDIRYSGGVLLFSASLKNSSGAKLTTGTTTLRIYEYQSDGTILSYDFNDNTFKSTSLTTATLAMTHRQGNNATHDTGVWTAALSTLTGFTLNSRILIQINNSSASPTDQEREFQFGGANGDFVVTSAGLVPWNSAWDAEVQSEVNDGLVAFFGASWATAISALMSTTVDGVALSTVLARIFAGSIGRRNISGTDPYTIECYGPGGTILATITASGGGGTVVYA